MLVRVLRWLLPWVCVLSASSAVAYAADLGLVHLFAPLDARRVSAPTSAAGGMREIQIVYMRPDGPASVLICLAEANNVTSDVLEVGEPTELAYIVKSVCVTNVEHDNRRGPH